MAIAEEFESDPVSPNKLQPARNFAASYAGEHVAGTEFVIGALFVAWGVSTYDILCGLLLGNLLAVLTWGLITAPIATDTRLTLYAYLEKIAGPGTIKLYSVVNGILFCVLAGSMITVSASAIRILFDIPPQVTWYPTDLSFVAVALVVGAVVVTIAMKGFQKVAQFAEICAPWMILMFVAGALASWPILVAATDGIASIGSLEQFVKVADTHIWVEGDTEIGFWHVAAFAWICNLAMHGSLGDMTLLRFARKSSYGYFSALGMFIGHFVAWICAGIMGAGAALIVKSSISQLDAGEVAYQVLGSAGILAVIIAGWTTSNPTIYRAGLAFQSLNHKWSRTKVTVVTGFATTVIACFPFVFTKLLGFVGIMGLMLAPVGAVIVAEHWLFPRIGLTRYWSSYRRNTTNYAAVITWILSLLFAFYLERSGALHLFFLLVPIWVFATVLYTTLASLMGAKQFYKEADDAERKERERKQDEASYLQKEQSVKKDMVSGSPGVLFQFARTLSILSLIVCAVMAVSAFMGSNLDQFRNWLIVPTIVYFISATFWINGKEKLAERSKIVRASYVKE